MCNALPRSTGCRGRGRRRRQGALLGQCADGQQWRHSRRRTRFLRTIWFHASMLAVHHSASRPLGERANAQWPTSARAPSAAAWGCAICRRAALSRHLRLSQIVAGARQVRKGGHVVAFRPRRPDRRPRPAPCALRRNCRFRWATAAAPRGPRGCPGPSPLPVAPWGRRRVPALLHMQCCSAASDLAASRWLKVPAPASAAAAAACRF